MNWTTDDLIKGGIFSDIDVHLAGFLTGRGAESDPVLYLVVLLLSNRLAQGDVCLDIPVIAGRPLSDFTDSGESHVSVKVPSEKEIRASLKKSGIAGGRGELLPLILEGDRVYFHKYHFFEQKLADSVKNMASPAVKQGITPQLQKLFARLFPATADGTDWQGVAAWCSLNSCFSVISGGPGTGKTSTVIRILALLIEFLGRDISIALAAPTGKASARLRESITASIGSLPVSDDIKNIIPHEAHTIHRLLGSRSGSTEFIHNRENPLRYDVIAVDECSMADLALMYRFFEAVKPGARVILLGDRDQLSSVEGGAVFGDICDRGITHGYSADFIEKGAELMGEGFVTEAPSEAGPAALSDSMTILRKSYRFSGESGIGVLADFIRNGDTDGVRKLLAGGEYGDVLITGGWHRDSIENVFREEVDRHLTADGDPVHESILGFIKSFAILTATRRGPGGAEELNRIAEMILDERGIIVPSAGFYEGRPVMVTRNDYSLSLFNGDIGVTCLREGGLRVMFEKSDGEKVYIPVSRMPEHETAFAMTIHKSQGSEFDRVLVALPEVNERLMTRELLYTAVTRGREGVILASDIDTVADMIGNPMKRMTGLREKLWGIT
ncbi:MAG TPA: exodeoxyribonuclease V subunit alpha [Spirochaetota bacterium]|nr:exodeoxyribonuclease V subunit alpha [Spirochaetota bacterium]